MSVKTLRVLLHETALRHGSFEEVAPPHDWWDWYAAYMVGRQHLNSPEEASAAADRRPRGPDDRLGSPHRRRATRRETDRLRTHEQVGGLEARHLDQPVGTHLRAVFAKLGVQSRVQLANTLHTRLGEGTLD